MTKSYRTIKEARKALSLDTGFDPFIHGGVQDSDGRIWRRPSKEALAALGYPVEPPRDVRMA